MLFNKCFIILLLPLLVLLSSCASKKNLVYFQNGVAADTTNFNSIYHTDDLLSITVSSMDELASKPFNLVISSLSPDGKMVGTPAQVSYLIDESGMIDFPVIGKIKLAGLTKTKAIALFKEKLQEFIADPIVNIYILNFKVTVLGEVARPGTYTINSERLTLLQALGLASDLNITGVRKNVLIIRDIDGKKTETRIDLTTDNIFKSPVYYLCQNDVVYVQPNTTRINSSRNSATTSIVISATSLFITLIALLIQTKFL